MFSNTRQNTSQNDAPAQTTSKTMISIHFPDHNIHIRETLERIFDQSVKLGDVLLKVGSELREFRCHRTILSFSSDFLNKLLLQTSGTGKDPVIILPEFDADIMECVLTYIYTGELNISSTVINGFIDVCTLLEIKGIVDQQYKLLDLIETSNGNDESSQQQHGKEEEENEKEELDEYTIIQKTYPDENIEEDEELGDENDVTISDEDSIMEEEYVLEEETSEIVTSRTGLSKEMRLQLISSPKTQVPNSISQVLNKHQKNMDKTLPPLKKVRLKQVVLPKTKHILRLEKLNFAFNEIEGSVGSWKHARLLTDGTANINAANAQYFKERLEVCTAKIYENVVLDDVFTEKYKVRMYFCADPVRLKALVECLICQKSIQVSYKHKNGKFKQWINSNVLRHVETLHKSQKGKSGDLRRRQNQLF